MGRIRPALGTDETDRDTLTLLLETSERQRAIGDGQMSDDSKGQVLGMQREGQDGKTRLWSFF